jgi:geranylgeranyl diphosphate synthase type II
MDIKSYLKTKREAINSFVERHLSNPFQPDVLRESILYSLRAGGKRIRPILCIASYEACSGDSENIIPYAASLEFIHTYSLIHDDLPAMDNDDLRRGLLTNHKVFGEGMAILAGDALLTEAFYIISNNELSNVFPSDLRLRVIRELSLAAGLHGMVAGQAEDLLSENKEPDIDTLMFIHSHKTGAIITASVRIGGILANCDEKMLSDLTNYGEKIGLAFQIVDDILDVEGSTEEIGKPKGSDEKKKKLTYPKLYGLDKSKEIAIKLVKDAIDSLKGFDEKADPLRAIARYLIERKN